MLSISEYIGDKVLLPEEVAKIQSEICKQKNGRTPKGSIAARAQAGMHKQLQHIKTVDPHLVNLYADDTLKDITKHDAAKLASVVGRRGKGKIPKKSFAAQLQSVADRTIMEKEKYGSSKSTVHGVLRKFFTFPITQDEVTDLQREAMTKYGRIPKGSIAACAQAAVQKAETEMALGTFHVKYNLLHDQDNKRTLSKLQSKLARVENVTNLPKQSVIEVEKLQSTVFKTKDHYEKDLSPNRKNIEASRQETP
jgi:hypothetical protein